MYEDSSARQSSQLRTLVWYVVLPTTIYLLVGGSSLQLRWRHSNGASYLPTFTLRRYKTVLTSPGLAHSSPQPSSTCSFVRLCEESFVEGRKACIDTFPLCALNWTVLVHFQQKRSRCAITCPITIVGCFPSGGAPQVN